eukprot:150980_1
MSYSSDNHIHPLIVDYLQTSGFHKTKEIFMKETGFNMNAHPLPSTSMRDIISTFYSKTPLTPNNTLISTTNTNTNNNDTSSDDSSDSDSDSDSDDSSSDNNS